MKSKMKPIKIIMTVLILSTLTAGAMAFAGGDSVGHGGNVVACFKDSKVAENIAVRARLYKKLKNHLDPIGMDVNELRAALKAPPELLELYTIRREKNLGNSQPTLISSPVDYKTGVNDAYQRAKNTNSFFWKYYLDVGAQALPLESFNTDPDGISEVDDSNSVPRLPKGCLVLQIALQTPTGNSWSVNIDDRLFSLLLNNLDRTALITHEQLVYKTMVIDHDPYSDRASKMNTILYRKDFSPQNGQMYRYMVGTIKRPGKSSFYTDIRILEGDCGAITITETGPHLTNVSSDFHQGTSHLLIAKNKMNETLYLGFASPWANSQELLWSAEQGEFDGELDKDTLDASGAVVDAQPPFVYHGFLKFEVDHYNVKQEIIFTAVSNDPNIKQETKFEQTCNYRP